MKYGYSFTQNNNKYRSLINDYFSNPVMTKVKNENKFSVYMVSIHTLLLNEPRYLIAMTHEDYNKVGSKQPLKTIEWIYFQTRYLKDQYDISQHSYLPTNDSKYSIPITVKSRTDSQTTYQTKDKQLDIILLHSNKNMYEFGNQGTLISALETYKTILYIH